MTPDEERVVRRVASELYELARVARNDADGTFVAVRRTFLASLAADLMRPVQAAEKGDAR